MNYKKRISYLLPIAGVIVLLAYLNFSVFGIPLSQRLAWILAFAIGPVAILGVLHLNRRLKNDQNKELLKIATVFLTIAFALLNLMIVVQQTLFATYRVKMGDASEPAKEILRESFSLVNQVQLGIDVSFDIFYCIGLMSLAVVLIKFKGLMMAVGIFGFLSALGLLVLNLSTFPMIPAESGLIDLGPATGVFWLVLFVILSIEKYKQKRSLSLM